MRFNPVGGGTQAPPVGLHVPVQWFLVNCASVFSQPVPPVTPGSTPPTRIPMNCEVCSASRPGTPGRPAGLHRCQQRPQRRPPAPRRAGCVMLIGHCALSEGDFADNERAGGGYGTVDSGWLRHFPPWCRSQPHGIPESSPPAGWGSTCRRSAYRRIRTPGCPGSRVVRTAGEARHIWATASASEPMSGQPHAWPGAGPKIR
jgi:hypothetical protein